MTPNKSSASHKQETKALFGIVLLFVALLSGIGYWLWAILAQKNEDIREVFIIETQENIRVGLWITKYHGKKAGADYEQFLHVFDLTTPGQSGSIRLEQKTHDNDYRLFRADENKAWGCSRKSGLMLIDLSQPSILAGQAQIVEKHPVLADGFKCLGYKEPVNPDQRGLYLKTANGSLYRLMEDLSIEKVLSVPLDNHHQLTGKTGLNWQFQSLKHSKGKHVHKIGSASAADSSTTLLNPQIISGLNSAFSTEPPHDKLWVAHQSALYGQHNLLLSYMLENGLAKHTLNTSELLEQESLTARGLYSTGKQTFIFLSIKADFRSTPILASLYALRTDTKTGKLLEVLTFVE